MGMDKEKKIIDIADIMSKEDDGDMDLDEILGEPDLMDMSLVTIARELSISNILTILISKYGSLKDPAIFTPEDRKLYEKVYNMSITSSILNDDDDDVE